MRTPTLTLTFLVASLPVYSSAQAPRIRDSAGVRIVENRSRLKAPIAFRLGDKATFDAGGLESDPTVEINSRQGYLVAIRLSNGDVAVIDRARIHFFNAAGTRLKITGREGGGPGEFRAVAGLCRTRGDTIIAPNGYSLPLNIFDKSGTFLFSSPLGENGAAEGQFCFDDGTYFLVKVLPGNDNAPRPGRLTRMKLDGTEVNRIAEVMYPAFDMLIRRSPGLAARGQRLYFGAPESFDIQIFTADGKLASIIRTDDQLSLITPEERQKLRPSAYRAGSTEAEREAAAQRARAASKTKYWPTLGRFLVDDSGRLWVEDWAQFDPLGGSAWTAFDAEGRLLGRLTIPAAPTREKAVYVVHFGRDEVFLRRFDDDGAIHFTAYPLVPVKK